MSKVVTIGELVGAGNDLVEGLKVFLETGKLPDFSSSFAKLAAITTFAGVVSKSKYLRTTSIVSNLGALGVDAYQLCMAIEKRKHRLHKEKNKLERAINSKDTDAIVESSLSLVTDIASIVSIFAPGPVKLWAITIALIATAIKETYKNREEITQYLTSVSEDMKNRLKYNPNVFLNLPNSAIRCHVVNGLNMNKGPMYQGVFSQNRLHPQIPTSNQQRTALIANDLHRKFKETYANYSGGPAYLDPDFEWKKPGVLEWRANRKSR